MTGSCPGRAHPLHSSAPRRGFMKKLVLVLGLAAALAGCARKDLLEIPTGSDVSVQKRDGVTVTGRLVEVKPEQIVVETRDGTKIQVPRSEIATLRAMTTEPAKP